jgi:Na+-translocating ferredoxin:NAD+ oxidoreductase RnfC subunit
VGTVVCNVSTLVNIAAALDGKKVIEKYVTVGGAVKNPVTLRVPVGTSLKELLEAAGGTTEDCDYIIGGPCMGRVVDTLDIPVTKTTGGLLAIPKNHPLLAQKSTEIHFQKMLSVCCQCSMCTQMCPRNALGLNVQPHKAMRSLANGVDLLGDINGIFSCCNCGLCTYYACNFGLKPSQVMQSLKSAIASKGTRPRKQVFTEVDGGLNNKKVPVSRLIARLGLSKYDVAAPLQDKLLATDCVRIALRMGVGAPSAPKVQVGDKVRKNQLIADIAEGKLGVKMHASLSGTVTDITNDYIEIRRTAK